MNENQINHTDDNTNKSATYGKYEDEDEDEEEKRQKRRRGEDEEEE